jgi:hypothetical protein
LQVSVPRFPLALLAALALIPAAPAAAAWRTVTFHHTVRAADGAALDRAGARGVHPAGARSYVAFVEGSPRIAGATVRRIRAAEKVATNLRPGAELATVVRLRGDRRVSEVVRLDSALTPFAIARRTDVLHVATTPVRMHLEDEGSSQIQAGNLDDQGKPVADYFGWLDRIGFNGKGVRIAIVDTGLDATHPDLEGKVAERIDYEYDQLPVQPETPMDVDEQGHGTHVAGIVVGNPDEEGPLAFKDDSGLYFGLGVAPGAEIVAQNGISLTSPELVPLIPILARDALRAGAFAWNASWHTGEGAGVGYLESARVVDAIIRDADPEAAGNQPFTMVFSAGNEGSGEKTITSPKEAKNVITVGATKGQRAGGSPDDVASFSSRGPAADGRIEPTISAPGEAISSARSKPAGGLCFEPATGGTSPIHSNCSGTSMASPHVAGAVAILVDQWRRSHGADPSPAMVKALLVNSATDMADRDVPNGNEGWGRVNLGAHFATPETDRIVLDQADLLTEPGSSRGLRFTPVDPAKPLRATLVWTDAPGKAVAKEEEKERPALVNDLDLSVTTPAGTAFTGNAFAEGRSVPGGPADRLNNVENVWLDQAGTGTYSLAVAANALPGDGVPGVGDTTDQDFALVVSNARIVADVVPVAPFEDQIQPSLRILTGKAKLGRRVRVTLRTNVPLRSLTATLSRSRRAVGRAKLARLAGTRRLTVKLPRRVRPGTYVLTVKARTAEGRAVAVQRKIALAR